MFNKSNLWEIVENNSEMFHFDTPIKEILNTEKLDLVLKSGFNKTYTNSPHNISTQHLHTKSPHKISTQK